MIAGVGATERRTMAAPHGGIQVRTNLESALWAVGADSGGRMASFS